MNSINACGNKFCCACVGKENSKISKETFFCFDSAIPS